MAEILYIQTSNVLNQFIKTIEHEAFVAVDTEFMREKTYWPILCLIQLATPNHCALIDPLAPNLELDAFFSLMEKPDIIKVFHSGRQDIEIIYHLRNIIPQPLFDTQIAALALGYRESIAYDQLVEELLAIKIDKSMRRTNWQKRPLTQAQKEYALADVTYLCDIYLSLSHRLKQQKRINWLTEETAQLLNPETYLAAPETAWKKIKNQLNKPKSLTLLQKLAAWREEKAREQNQPRGHIIKDNALLDIIMLYPKQKSDFEQLKLLPKYFSDKDKQEILDIIQLCDNLPKESLLKHKKITQPSMAETLALDLLKLLLKTVALEEKIAPRLIANMKDLELLAQLAENAPLIKAQDWRYSLFGKKALHLLRGQLSISFENNKIKFTDIANSSP